MALLSFDQATTLAKQSAVEIYLISIHLDHPQFSIYQLDFQGWSDPKDEEFLYVEYSGSVQDDEIKAEVLPETKIKINIQEQLFFSPTYPVDLDVLKEYLSTAVNVPKDQEDPLAAKFKQVIDRISGLVE
ncbi:MAG: hypothetical protein COB04_04005 [Gammaproteobacteria bacterium]|nr:MAG: hypothetical protein COB04_04005 [Gammaproteobacteria bacterium]